MSDAVLVAVISGLLSLAGIIITGIFTNRKADHRQELAQQATTAELKAAQAAQSANLEKIQMENRAQLEKAQLTAEARLHETQAVTATKIEDLTKAVEKHNNFASRMPVVEEQIRVINHRLQDLENI